MVILKQIHSFIERNLSLQLLQEPMEGKLALVITVVPDENSEEAKLVLEGEHVDQFFKVMDELRVKGAVAVDTFDPSKIPGWAKGEEQ